jgi:restriction system protein
LSRLGTVRGVSITRIRRRRLFRRWFRRLRRRHPWLLLAVALGLVLGLVLAARAAWMYAQAHPVTAGAAVVAVAAAVGGLVWGRRRLRRPARGIAVTDGMTGPQFEHYVADLMRRSGFRAVRVTGRAADLGADILASTADGRRVVVQCKRYAGSVGSPHVQRLNGTAWTIHGAEVTMLVTTGRLTAHARQLAGRCGIVLVDRAALAAWLADPPRVVRLLPPPVRR